MLREILGYLLIVICVGLIAAGIWAARYYSPGRRYARQLAAERNAARLRREGDRQAS